MTIKIALFVLNILIALIKTILKKKKLVKFIGDYLIIKQR